MTTHLKRPNRYARHDRARSLLDAVSDWFARVTRLDSFHADRLDLLALEDRVYFNAAPLGDMTPDATDVVSEQVDDVINLIDLAVHAQSGDVDELSALDELPEPNGTGLLSAQVDPDDGDNGDDADDAVEVVDIIAAEPSRDASYEIVFVDQGVADYESLVRDIQQRQSTTTMYEVILLNANESGVARISALLSERQDVDAIHLVSHGSDGGLRLGSDWLTSENVAGYAWQLDEWRFALGEDADLLIYGCDLASSDAGRELLTVLAAACDCDVAASTDDTGHAMFGGDWDLEYSTGSIETNVAFSEYTQAEWGHLLNVTTVVVDTVSDLVNGDTSSIAALILNKGADNAISLGEAILATNNTPNGATPDTILFNIAGIGLHTISLSSALPGITDSVIIDATTQTGYAGLPLIQVISSIATSNGFSLQVGSDGSTVRGFIVGGFSGNGIEVLSDNNLVELNYIGTNSTGLAANGNSRGVVIDGGQNNTIRDNLISGNASYGIWIHEGTGTASGNKIIGNLIGTTSNGAGDLGNLLDGLRIETSGTQIGGTAAGAGNTISGNDGNGVILTGSRATGNTLLGNKIGVSSSGSVTIGNLLAGVVIENGASLNVVGDSADRHERERDFRQSAIWRGHSRHRNAR